MSQLTGFLYVTGPVIGILSLWFVISSFYRRPTLKPTEHTPKQQTEALKALAEWSKWLISIETALIVLLVALLQGDIPMGRLCLSSALLSFVISIIAATVLIGAIPGDLEEVPILDKTQPKNPSADIYAYKFLCIPIRRLAGIEHVQFIAGLIFGLAGIFRGCP